MPMYKGLSVWYMLWYMLHKHIPWLKTFVYRCFNASMVYGYMFLGISLNRVKDLPLRIRMFIRIPHKIPRRHHLYSLVPPSGSLEGAKS